MQEPKLIECLPEFSKELEHLLQKEGRPDLIPQLSTLRIFDRCRCGDDFCATIYTACKSDREYGISDTIPLHPDQGFVILDLRDRRITGIEILYRDEIRKEVLGLLG